MAIVHPCYKRSLSCRTKGQTGELKPSKPGTNLLSKANHYLTYKGQNPFLPVLWNPDDGLGTGGYGTLLKLSLDWNIFVLLIFS